MAPEGHEFITNMAGIQFNMLKILVRNFVGAEHVGDTGLGRRIILKRISENEEVMVWTRFKILMQIEHGTEPS
jgi:hypothetical protein